MCLSGCRAKDLLCACGIRGCIIWGIRLSLGFAVSNLSPKMLSVDLDLKVGNQWPKSLENSQVALNPKS